MVKKRCGPKDDEFVSIALLESGRSSNRCWRWRKYCPYWLVVRRLRKVLDSLTEGDRLRQFNKANDVASDLHLKHHHERVSGHTCRLGLPPSAWNRHRPNAARPCRRSWMP